MDNSVKDSQSIKGINYSELTGTSEMMEKLQESLKAAYAPMFTPSTDQQLSKALQNCLSFSNSWSKQYASNLASALEAYKLGTSTLPHLRIEWSQIESLSQRLADSFQLVGTGILSDRSTLSEAIAEPKVDVPERFYEVAEPLLPLVETFDESQPEIASSVKDAITNKLKWMNPDRFLTILGMLITLAIFALTCILSNISDQQQAVRDQMQLEATQKTNALFEKQIELSEDQLRAQHAQLALLRSLNDDLEYLIDLHEAVSDEIDSSADGSDPDPKPVEDQQIDQLSEDQTEPN